MPMTIVYGGTFDPVHNGHIAVAELVAASFNAPVALIPAADPPHRPPPGASAEQRVAMLRLAIAGHPCLRLDTRELQRSGPSYTIDTLLALRSELGAEMPVIWVVGADSLRALASWKRWRELFDLAHLLAVARRDHPVDPLTLAADAPEVAAQVRQRQCSPEQLACKPAGGFALLKPEQLFPESATDIREQAASTGDWRRGLAPAVADFIQAQGLYGVGRV